MVWATVKRPSVLNNRISMYSRTWLICIFLQTLQQLKDKSKRESFKPFDRSFLIKRQATGEDIFRGASKKYKASLTEKIDEEIQKLWRENGDLSGNTSFVISKLILRDWITVGFNPTGVSVWRFYDLCGVIIRLLLALTWAKSSLNCKESGSDRKVNIGLTGSHFDGFCSAVS